MPTTTKEPNLVDEIHPIFPSIYLPGDPNDPAQEFIQEPPQELINNDDLARTPSPHLTSQSSKEFTREPSKDLTLDQLKDNPEELNRDSLSASVELIREPSKELKVEPLQEEEDFGKYDTLRERYYTINTLSATFTPSYFSSFPPPLPMSHFTLAAAQASMSPLGVDPDAHIKFKEYVYL